MWKVIKASIKKASKNWIFKDVKWKIPELDKYNKEYIQYIKKSNLKKSSKPFSGKQDHFIIFHFINEAYDYSDIEFVYQIDVEQNMKYYKTNYKHF